MSTNVEHRVDALESVLARSITNTAMSLARFEENTAMSLASFKENTELSLARFERKTEASLAKLGQEMAEFKDEMAEFKRTADADRKHMNKKWGELANKWGTVVEDIVAPNIPRIAHQYFGVDRLEDWGPRRRRTSIDPSLPEREFDIVAVGGRFFFLNETKATAKTNDVTDFVDLLPLAPSYFPEHTDKTLVPLFASFSLSPELVKLLTKNRIYGMVMADDTMDLVNYEEVQRQAG